MFIWANKENVKNWTYRTKAYLNDNGMAQYSDIDRDINKRVFMSQVADLTDRINEERWQESITKEESKTKKGKNKLRTYKTFKSTFVKESYVCSIMAKKD